MSAVIESPDCSYDRNSHRWLNGLFFALVAAAVWGCGSRAQSVDEEAPPRPSRPLRFPPKYFSPLYYVTTMADSARAVGVLRSQQGWAHERWFDMDVVRYQINGGDTLFRGLDLACNVTVDEPPFVRRASGDYSLDFTVFPAAYVDQITPSVEAGRVRNLTVLYPTPVVVAFPQLGYWNSDQSDVIRKPLEYGNTPGVVDPQMTGLVLLAEESIRSSQGRDIPSPLAHEMLHVFSGIKHNDSTGTAGRANRNWSFIMNVWSAPRYNLPVWDGRQSVGSRVRTQTWDATLLTIISAYTGTDTTAIDDQCTLSRNSTWLH